MTYDEWLPTVPERMTRDPIWRRNDYRLAVYVADASWSHMRLLATTAGMRSTADQLNRALGSISANIAEGYSRGGGADRVRYYEFALGSARESREWYWRARHVIGVAVADAQCATLDSIVRLLLTAIPAERTQRLRPSRPREDLHGKAGGANPWIP